MTSCSIDRLQTQPYVCSPEATLALATLDPSVIDLLTNVFDNRLADADVDRIEVTKGGTKAANIEFTVYVQGDRMQALVLWFGIDGEIEMSEDRLGSRARKQLAERVAIRVEPLD